MKATMLVILTLAAAVPANAQDEVTTPPPSLVLNNYASVPVGPFGGLEGSSIVSRVGDPSAAWFNPAGLDAGEHRADQRQRGRLPENNREPAGASRQRRVDSAAAELCRLDVQADARR